MRTVRILAAAAEEAAEAAAWYEQEHPGLGIEFERAIDGVLDLLEQDIVPLTSMPGIAGKRGVKRLMLKRFPSAVVVRELEAETSLRLLIMLDVQDTGALDCAPNTR